MHMQLPTPRLGCLRSRPSLICCSYVNFDQIAVKRAVRSLARASLSLLYLQQLYLWSGGPDLALSTSFSYATGVPVPSHIP